MSKAKWCVRCGEDRAFVEAVEEVDGDPLCGMHARLAHALAAGWAKEVTVPLKPAAPVEVAPVRNHTLKRLCGRGCGKETHYGRCVGEEYLPVTVQATAVAPVKPGIDLIEAYDAHLEREAAKEALCSRGCGKPTHRGLCKGAMPTKTEVIAKAAAVAKAVVQEERKSMDVLKFERIPVSEVPAVGVRLVGRLGALWAELMRTPKGEAMKVLCRDAEHAGHTSRHLRGRARRMKVEIETRRVGADFYCWRVGADGAAR